MATNKLLLWGGLGIVGYLLYKHFHPATAPVPSGPVPYGTQVDPVTEFPVANPVTQLGQSTVPTSPGVTVPAGIDPQVYGVVLAWLQLDADPQMTHMLDNPIPAEFNGLYNIIANNLWESANATYAGSAVEAFWNALYAKYHS